MRRTASVVVVGGGINGVSALFHLVKAGVKDVLLLEKGALAEGGTGKSVGIVRMYYDNAAEASLAWESYPTFRYWDDIIGYGSCDFVQTGLLVLPKHGEVDGMLANIAMLQDVGTGTAVVDRETVIAMFPALYHRDITTAGWSPAAGYADPASTVGGMAEAARALGAEIQQGVAVTAIHAADSKITGVSTSAGEITCPTVLLATGCWTVRLVKPLGLDLPCVPRLTQIASVERPPEFASPVPHPIVFDDPLDMYYRPETGGLTVAGIEEMEKELIADPDNYRETLDDEFTAMIVDRLPRRMPFMDDARFTGGWTGPLDRTSDRQAILDQAGPDGLYLIAGSSGHGFKTGPAVGRCMAELITEGRARTVDISRFRLGRFTDGESSSHGT